LQLQPHSVLWLVSFYLLSPTFGPMVLPTRSGSRYVTTPGRTATSPRALRHWDFVNKKPLLTQWLCRVRVDNWANNYSIGPIVRLKHGKIWSYLAILLGPLHTNKTKQMAGRRRTRRRVFARRPLGLKKGRGIADAFAGFTAPFRAGYRLLRGDLNGAEKVFSDLGPRLSQGFTGKGRRRKTF
jgi:hypothetical protein